MTLMDVAYDFAVVSILLAIGYFLRMKVKLFQRLFLPASIIGGLVMSTLITLFIIPVLYSIVDDIETKNGKKRLAKKNIRLYREALWLAKRGAKHAKK